MRKTYHYETVNGERVLVEGPAPPRYGGVKVGSRQAPYVMGDIPPTKIHGQTISSRGHYRKYLRENGLIEIGDQTEALMNLKPQEPSAKERVADIKDSIEMCRAGKGVKDITPTAKQREILGD